MQGRAGHVILIVLVVLFAAWQLNHLGGLRWDWDEGVYLSTARLAAGGEALYGDLFCTAPPLFINSIQAGFALTGQTIAAGRGVVVLYAALGLLAAGLIAWELAGPVAAIAAVLALAVAPHFYMLSRVVIADVPSMAMSAIALWAGLRYARGGRRGWLIAAGALLSLGALIKMTAVLAGPAIAYAVVAREVLPGSNPDRNFARRIALDVALLAAGFVVPIAAYTPFVSWAGYAEQSLLLIWNQTETFVPDHAMNADMVWRYLVLDNRSFAINRGLTILGMLGLVASTWRKPRLSVTIWLWLAMILFAMWSYAPLWPHLLSPLLFPLAVGAGLAVAELWSARPWSARKPGAVGILLLAALLIGLGAYGLDLPRIAHEDSRRGAAPDGDDERQAVAWLQARTLPGEWVVTDEPILAFVAGRSVPPSLVDASIVRIAVGKLSTEQLVEATQDARTTAVVLWKDNRFGTYLPDYVRWVEEHWEPALKPDEKRRIFAPTDSSAQ